MARRPFFSGNYGSALGSFDTAARLIAQAGQTQGQAMANIGKQIGDTIEEYQLNKEKRDKSEAAFQADAGRLAQDDREKFLTMQADPVIGPTLKKIQEGKGTQRDFDKYHAYRAADREATIAKLRMDNAKTQQGMLEVQARVEERLADPTVRKAIGEADRAEAYGNYAGSIVSADYAAKIQDNALKSAQTKYQQLKNDLLESGESFSKGDVIEREGVKFIYTGETFQPLNEGVSRKAIEEAMIRGLDQAQLKVYLDENYNYDQETDTYTFDSTGFFGGGKRNPMMEEAITILGLRGKVKDDSETESETSTESETVLTGKQKLAQEALMENSGATEEEKEAARKILGQ